MKRLDAVQTVAPLVTAEDLFISSIGAILDDWWNLRPGPVDNTFSPSILGSVSSTALGLALALPHRRVVALETDGSVLMNTGVMCTLGNQRPGNMTVVVFDNGIYECIGGPPTLTSGATDLARMADGAGCPNVASVDDTPSLKEALEWQLNDGEFGYLVAKIEPGVHSWPKDRKRFTDGVEDKYRFIRYIESLEQIVVHPGSPHV